MSPVVSPVPASSGLPATERPTNIKAVFLDWAGTITVSNRQLFTDAVEGLEFSDEQKGAAIEVMTEYFTQPDSIMRQAEIGKADDDDLREYLDSKVPGSGRLFDTTGPSFLNGADRPEMVELMTDLTDAGYFVLIATNNFDFAHDLLARRYLETGLAHGVANSALMGVRKPDPVFYELCLEAAGVDPKEALFVDDQEVNVLAASECGLYAVQIDDDPTAAIAVIRAATLDRS